MSKDPVCNAFVDEREAGEAKLTSDYDGHTYYFCSADCKEKFDSAPADHAPLVRWPEDWPTDETEQPMR